ncbi:MAG: hypothetical protein N2202_05575 [Proteobacteria bacterium]|nr:hypothetical protein [Pseudomonadota bacterium]
MSRKDDELEEHLLDDFLEREKKKILEETKEVDISLEQMYQRLIKGLDILEEEIKRAQEEGDENLWISLTNRKSIILQNLFEVKRLLKK